MEEKETVMSEEEYILSHGGDAVIGNGIFLQSHIGRNGESVAELERRLDDILPERARLRREYGEKIRNGEIRDYTIEEKLKAAARGHEDNEATWAARRCCEKRGIRWN